MNADGWIFLVVSLVAAAWILKREIDLANLRTSYRALYRRATGNAAVIGLLAGIAAVFYARHVIRSWKGP